MRKSIHQVNLILLPIALWMLIASMTPRYLIASPYEVAQLLLSSWHIFIDDILITLLESLGGLIIAIMVTFSIAVVFQLVPRLKTLGMPYAIAMKSIPVVAIAPLLVIWFGNGLTGKITLAALICFFPLLIGLLDGMKSLPKELHLLASVWSTSKLRTLFLLELPHATPYLFSALKVAAPLAVVGAVVAEFSGADQGLGHVILIASYQTDTPLLFAGIILVSLLGIGLYSIVASLEKICLRAMRVQSVFGTV